MGSSIAITVRDKRDDPLEIRGCSESDSLSLLKMYESFTPKPASQGLPPPDPEACRRWVQKLLKDGENFLAWREGRVIGHASIMPDDQKKDGEFLIFVDQAYRNRGVGKALTNVALGEAGELGLTSIWLTVETYNFRAIHLYRKCGFQTCGQDDHERKMIRTVSGAGKKGIPL
jgi:ribosomal protein S18 acetylase RimI-like enzyme